MGDSPMYRHKNKNLGYNANLVKKIHISLLYKTYTTVVKKDDKKLNV